MTSIKITPNGADYYSFRTHEDFTLTEVHYHIEKELIRKEGVKYEAIIEQGEVKLQIEL